VIDAMISGAGVGAQDFDLGKLVDIVPLYTPNVAFRYWANAAENMFLTEFTNFELCEENVLIPI
jgi:hypothetical protein